MSLTRALSLPSPVAVSLAFAQHALLAWGGALPPNVTSQLIPDMVFKNQFQDWYPQYGFVFESIVNDNCSSQFAAYRNGKKNYSNIDWYGGGDEHTALSQPVVQCIMNNTSDYIKSSMSSAQVLLGLTPTILALLGASTEELSLLSVVARRPGLATLLSLASPSVFVSRAFEFGDPAAMLQDREGRLRQFSPRNARYWLLTVGEYVVALGLGVNIVFVNWDLGQKTVCTFWSDNILAPTLWGVLVFFIHVGGGVLMRIRARRVFEDPIEGDKLHQVVTPSQWFRGLWRRLLSLPDRAPPCRQPEGRLRHRLPGAAALRRLELAALDLHHLPHHLWYPRALEPQFHRTPRCTLRRRAIHAFRADLQSHLHVRDRRAARTVPRDLPQVPCPRAQRAV